MQTASGLRRRLIIAAIAIAAAVSIVFAGGFAVTLDLAEDILLEPHLEADAQSFMTAYAMDPEVARHPRSSFQVHIAPGGDLAVLPDDLRALPAGSDELRRDGREYDVQIRRRSEDVFYFLFDETAVESFERLVVGALLLITGIVMAGAVWLSRALSDRVIRPLTDLSQQVARLDDTGERELSLPIAVDPADEIAMLTAAFNRYHRRLREVLRREREFSADVSHELRTPLMGIQGASELLTAKLGADSGAELLLARIERGCLQMTTLIEALLYLGRDPTSFKDLVEPVSVERIVDEQLAAVRDALDRKGIAVHVERAAAGTVNTVPAVISIVLGNVIKNAVKYTTGNLINVLVTGDTVVVQDFGPGIDAASQAVLFDRYSRGTRQDRDGTGIGLALVKRFCDQNGWSIVCQSEEPRGTRFAVHF